MSVKKILRLGHPVLREIAKSVPDQDINSMYIQNTISNMIDTLEESGGIGLAAPQIGESLRIVIVKIPAGNSKAYGELAEVPLSIFINPIITPVGKETASYWEGCLSIPGLRGLVSRPQHIMFKFQSPYEKQENKEIRGFLATVLQHECDHLDGKLYVDHLADSRNLAYEEEYTEFIVR